MNRNNPLKNKTSSSILNHLSRKFPPTPVKNKWYIQPRKEEERIILTTPKVVPFMKAYQEGRVKVPQVNCSYTPSNRNLFKKTFPSSEK